MEIEKQVATLEQCKKLKDLGIEFDSFFKYLVSGSKATIKQTDDIAFDEWYPYIFSAPTSQELLDKIPTGIIIDNQECALEIYCHGEYCVWFNDDVNFDSQNLATALADMLIWIKENGYLINKLNN